MPSRVSARGRGWKTYSLRKPTRVGLRRQGAVFSRDLILLNHDYTVLSIAKPVK